MNKCRLNYLSKHRVLTVQPRSGDRRYEELAAVRVLAGVGHAEETGPRVIDLEILVVEVFAVDADRASSVAVLNITTWTGELCFSFVWSLVVYYNRELSCNTGFILEILF